MTSAQTLDGLAFFVKGAFHKPSWTPGACGKQRADTGSEKAYIGTGAMTCAGCLWTTFHVHYLPDETAGPKGAPPPSSLQVLKALRTSRICQGLLDELKVNEENALLTVPFAEGPLGAVYAVQEMARAKQPFSKVVPVYLEHAEDYSRARLLCDRRGGGIPPAKRTLPLALAFEGGGGEVLLNSARSLWDRYRGVGQVAANVRIQTTRFATIQQTLDDFIVGLNLDFGYAEDSLAAQHMTSSSGFPADWDVVDDDPGLRARSMLRQLLFKPEKFNSPLRTIEVVRAYIIGSVAGGSQGIDHLRMLRSLDRVYDSLLEFKHEDREYRNSITHALIQSMQDSKLLSSQQRQNHNFLVKGPMWEQLSDLVASYSEFYLRFQTA